MISRSARNAPRKAEGAQVRCCSGGVITSRLAAICAESLAPLSRQGVGAGRRDRFRQPPRAAAVKRTTARRRPTRRPSRRSRPDPAEARVTHELTGVCRPAPVPAGQDVMDGAIPQEIAHSQIRIVARQGYPARARPSTSGCRPRSGSARASGPLLVRGPIGIGDLEHRAERLVGDRAIQRLPSPGGRRLRRAVIQARSRDRRSGGCLPEIVDAAGCPGHRCSRSRSARSSIAASRPVPCARPAARSASRVARCRAPSARERHWAGIRCLC